MHQAKIASTWPLSRQFLKNQCSLLCFLYGREIGVPYSQKKRRGTVIIEMLQGILLVQSRSGVMLLPGGQAEPGESRFAAAIRELHEETGLDAFCALSLFEYESNSNAHRVVWVRASGIPKPLDDAVALAYCTQNTITTFTTSPATRAILQRYWIYKQKHQVLFDTLQTVEQ